LDPPVSKRLISDEEIQDCFLEIFSVWLGKSKEIQAAKCGL